MNQDWSHQDRAIADVRRSMARGHRRVLLQSCTGSGKTRIAARIAAMADAKGSRVVVLAPRRELVYQLSRTFHQQGVTTGTLMAGEHFSRIQRHYVCSFDTVHSRAIQRETIELPPADLVVVDEAHLAVTDGRTEILSRYPDARHLLLSATPVLANGRGMNEIADDLVLGVSMSELIDKGVLVPLRYFAPSEPDLAALKLNKDGDYQEKGLAKAMDKPGLVGDIVDNWKRIAEGTSTVVFCVNRAHSEHMAKAFNEAGIPAEHVDAYTPQEQRKDIFRRVELGITKVLCNVFVASYGLDIPILQTAVLARPTKNIALYLQMVGRIMRAYPGKIEGLVIDHAGCVAENGFAEDPHPWSLDPRTKIKDRMQAARDEAEAPKEIRCAKCGYVFRSARKCPKCGFEMVKPTDPIPVHKADLQEVKRSEESAAERRNRTTPAEQKRRVYGELLHYCREKGKKEGWAANTYRDMFGVWPNAHKGAPPVKPSPDTLRYIRAKNIRFAKGQAAAR